MPLVEVKTWAGKSDAEKAMIIEGITKVFEKLGIHPERVTVIIHDVPKKNWGKGGKPSA